MTKLRRALEDRQLLIDGTLIAVGVTVLATLSPSIGGDGVQRFEAVERFAEDGAFTDMPYSFIGPFFSLPLWFLGHLNRTPQFWIARYNLMVFGLLLVAVWLLLRNRVDRGLARKLVLLLMAASMFPGHLLSFYGEVFTAGAVGVGLLAVARGWWAAGWGTVVVGAANMPSAIAGVAVAAAKRSLDQRRLRHLLAVGATVVVVLMETRLRRGEWLADDYFSNAGLRTVLPYSGLPGWSYPIFFGLLGILFSFGKGLVFFAPGLFLPVRQRLQALQPEVWNAHVLCLCFLAGLVVVYSRWWGWNGGFFWGPRFFLFASIPACLALATRLHSPSERPAANVVTVVLLALSCWVAVSGAVYQQHALDVCVQNDYALEHLCWHVPEFSALWHPFVVPKRLGGHDIAYIAFVAAVFARMVAPLLPPPQRWRSGVVDARRRYLPLEGWRV